MIGLCSTHLALGQKVKTPSRPSPERHVVDVSQFESFDAFLNVTRSTARSLKQSAVRVGPAQVRYSPVKINAVPQTASKSSSLLTHTSISRVVRAPNGTVRWFNGRLKPEPGLAVAGKQASASAYNLAAVSVFQENRDFFGIQHPDEELLSMSTTVDEMGFVHARFEQQYKQISVWGRDVYVHFDKQGEVYAINGSYEPTPSDLDPTPGFSVSHAEELVVQDLQSKQRWAPLDEETASMLGIDLVSSRQVWYPSPDGEMKLAYEVNIHPTAIEWYQYIIDAQTGETLNRIEQHCSLNHDAPLPPSHSVSFSLKQPDALSPSGQAASFVDAQGIDLAGDNRDFRALLLDDGSFLLQSDLDNLQAGSTVQLVPELGGSVVLDAQNNDLTRELSLIGIQSNSALQWSDPAAVSAHAHAEQVYAYYKNIHARNAIDDLNESLVSLVHATEDGQPMDNAFWNGRLMVYGDGASVFTPLSGALDVASHEMTHGVVQHTANLVYQFQSGALNESFADVFGVLVDPEDTLLGEDITIPQAGIGLRDLLNPGNPQVLSPQPASMAQFRNLSASQDNGGVHINSGIPNRAAALIMQSIGHEATGHIYYRALSSYLNRNSQFGDARLAVEQAAIDIHGDNSTELQVVQQAFDEVGIIVSSGTGGDEGNDIPVQTGGQSLIAFTYADGLIGFVDVTDRENVSLGLFEDPAAIARAIPEDLDFSQLSTPRSGEEIWFVNDEGQLSFVEMATNDVFFFPDLFIEEEGDLRNAAVSPDGEFVALVSSSFDDASLYFFDGVDLYVVPLKPESSQDGIAVESIWFPDVVNWSPNPTFPRIAFDAFNFQTVDGEDNEEYWNMYEMDFETQRIYELLPPQGDGVDVGNVNYSNTDPDVITFNIVQEDRTDIAIGDFSSGRVVSLDFSALDVTQAWRPSFSPDDTELVFYNPDNNELVITDLESAGTIEFGSTVYNPQWFVVGGSGGSQNQAPAAEFVVSTVSGTAPLEVQFDASASSDPEGESLTYNWDFDDGARSGGQLVTHTFSQGGSFEVILTVMDSGGLNSRAFIVIEVEGPSGVSTETPDELPQEVALHQNYPNPFNPTTQIQFDLPATDHVRLEVFDLLGRTVDTLVDGLLSAGSHDVTFDAADLPSGTYMVLLTTGDTRHVRQMVLLR